MANLSPEKAIPITATIPANVVREIDEIAGQWLTSRSAAITRIYLEWKQANRPQLPGLAPVEATSVEAPVKETI